MIDYEFDRPKTVIKIPEIINASNTISFLRNVAVIFENENKKTEDFAMDLSGVKKINVLGMLLIYKIIEFSVEKKCFHLPYIIFESFLEEKLDEYEFLPLINAYIQLQDSSPKMKNLKVQMTEKFILAPQPLLRNSNFTNKFLKTNFLPKINEYYEGKPKVISMISTCFSEILLNFWEHAVEDTKSIMIADGNQSFMEIACADTGNGILSSLRNNPKYSKLNDEDLIKRSTNKNVTSKENTNHMGYGLWIIDQIISSIEGRFHLYSEGSAYINDYGKIRTVKTGFWKGTIVYLALPLHNAKSLNDIETFKNKFTHSIKIDFI
jgi:hypothetical protein